MCARWHILKIATTVSPILHGLLAMDVTLCPLRGETYSFPLNLGGLVTLKEVLLHDFQSKTITGDTISAWDFWGCSLIESSHHALRKPNIDMEPPCVSVPANSYS